MSKRYALLIGISEYIDDKLNLRTPVQDAVALESVLTDDKIGAFDRVRLVKNASLQEMRLAIGEFYTQQHKPDDTLLLYFSGHGELDDDNKLYLMASDTRRGKMLPVTGLATSFIADLMNRARSRRQVLILDSCYSGAFGNGAKGGQVGTKNIFEGSGYGRYVLTASDALQLSWEGDRIIDGEIFNSFFTHFLVDGLATGSADLNGDGYIHIDELYDYIYENMIQVSGKQQPLKYTFREKGDLVIARSATSSEDRTQKQLSELLVNAEQALQTGDYQRAERLLANVMEIAGEGLLVETAKSMMQEIALDQSRSLAYENVKYLMVTAPRTAKAAWEAFQSQYIDYDPDDLARKINSLENRLTSAEEVLESRNPRTHPHSVTSPTLISDLGLIWVSIPTKRTKTILGIFGTSEVLIDEFDIAKYPITNQQYNYFVEAGGYEEARFWTEAGWRKNEGGWEFISGNAEKTGEKWTHPKYWEHEEFTHPDYPVQVSWYEALAYCNWLSALMSRKITLPTLAQWQYASRGGNNRKYPWGNNWDSSLCQNSVDKKLESPVSVKVHEGYGDSPFGVVDMVGNVSEWCLTKFDTLENEISGPEDRIVMGGDWTNYKLTYFSIDTYARGNPLDRYRGGIRPISLTSR